MNPIRILLVGDCSHQLLIAFIRSFKQYNKGFEFDAFSITKIKHSDCYHYANVNYARSFGAIYNSKIFRKFVYPFDILFNFLRLNQQYDVVHIHFARPIYLIIWPFIRLKGKKVIISVWGTEFLRANKRKKFLLGLMYKRADFIHCSNEELKSSIVANFNLNSDKLMSIPFFLENLNNLDNINLSKREAKSELNWNINKVQIVIGYNYNKGQQHISLLHELAKLPKNKFDKIEFVFPITYGSDLAYRETVIARATELPCKIHFYTEFLSNEKMCEIRLAGDVFINVQITDQFSASFVESLYAGNTVITGSWLPYRLLKEAKVSYLEIDNIKEINGAINYALLNLSELQKLNNKNKRILRDMFDQRKLANRWLEIYSKSSNNSPD